MELFFVCSLLIKEVICNINIFNRTTNIKYGQMCLHTSTRLYHRSRVINTAMAKIILDTLIMISTFISELIFFILRIQFKSEPAQTLMSEVFYSRPIKALSRTADQTSGKQIIRKRLGIVSTTRSRTGYPLADVFNIDTRQEAALLREYFASPRLSGKNSK